MIACRARGRQNDAARENGLPEASRPGQTPQGYPFIFSGENAKMGCRPEHSLLHL
jgi:hypothetical protein